MEGASEILIAMPPSVDDIYQRHQLVWKAMHDRVRRGDRFLYSNLSPAVVCVRGPIIGPARPTAPCDGEMTATFVVGTRNGSRMMPLDEPEIPGWVARKLMLAGYEANGVTVLARRTEQGRKVDRMSGRILEIVLPVAEVRFEGIIVNKAAAALAWMHGVGRGKRFGFGMLRKAA